MLSDLEKILLKYKYSDKYPLHNIVIRDCKLSFLQIRDRLLIVGNILYEDLENQVYVASIPAGIFEMNYAIIALQYQGDIINIIGYAKEGWLKQSICENALLKVKNIFEGYQIKKTNKKARYFLPFVIFFVIVATILIYKLYSNLIVDKNLESIETVNKHEENINGIVDDKGSDGPSISKQTQTPEEKAFNDEVEKTMEASSEYNLAVEKYNQLVHKYNEASLKTCLDNIEILPQKFDAISKVSESYGDIVNAIYGGNNKEKITSDTLTILDMALQVEHALAVVQQITAPTGEWVMERLNNVSEITETQIVTKEQNPDGLLGIEGGYSDCIYFSVDAALPNEVPGNSIVDKGTDAGGAVEVYNTLADAESRIEYLSGFDGTVLYSGSYAIVGTMVVRTSYKLSNDLQLFFTNIITSALTTYVKEND